MNSNLRALLPLLLLTPIVAGQTPQPAFEAASIHVLEAPFQRLKSLSISGTRVLFDGYSIAWLIEEAYGLKNYEVSTALVPRAQQGVFYRIDARVPGLTSPNETQVRVMLQALLADRFHLTSHREMRNTPVYALNVSKNGPVLKPGSETTDDRCMSLIGPVQPADRNYRYRFTNCTLEPLVNTLQSDRPILDKTGLTGKYDITIFATPEFRMTNTTEPGDIRFLDAIKSLGLQLGAQNVPIEILVVDHCDAAPSEN